jgi:hypothetical protein
MNDEPLTEEKKGVYNYSMAKKSNVSKAAKTTWGGARPGGGRKPGPDGKAVVLTITVLPPMLTAVEVAAKKQGCSRNKWVRDAISARLSLKQE